jgi:hypothetical protein
MARKETLYADIKNGSGGPIFRNQVAAAIQGFEGKRIKVSIEGVYGKRSLKQNKYYWGCIAKACKIGIKAEWDEDYSLEDCHFLLKYHCNYQEKVDMDTGEIIRLPLTTKVLKTIEFEEYEEKARRFIKQWFNIEIPLPNTQAALDYAE